ncbi:hypothetical protein BC938DRAFT_477571 [Jimgerdemannia flammicorona]|uniref:Uncharacterized protein n=1 Tax=Jimgerdemannia flammicorona TaxID=994334 RepID=A0A433QP70_9FUNG|nr:hypothetical protein BC938DRAFT_477571 [Jimgerdemannia flammicorona]
MHSVNHVQAGLNGRVHPSCPRLPQTLPARTIHLTHKFFAQKPTWPRAGKPLPTRGLVILARCVPFLEDLPYPFLVRLDLLAGERSLLLQLGHVLVERRKLLGNFQVHSRLREAGLVGLVVPVLAVAHDIDNDILPERLSPLHDERDRLDVVTIDVEHGGVDGLCNVGAVRRRAGEAGVGGEPDLVINDDVDGPAGGVGRECVETDSLVDNALGGDGSITVHDDGHSVGTLIIFGVELESSRLTQHHRVHGLQVGWVGNQG